MKKDSLIKFKKSELIIRLKKIFKCLVADFTDPFFANIAPGLAYYFLLSMAPIILALSYLFSFFLMSKSLITTAISKYLPVQIANILIPFFSKQSNSYGFITTIFFFVLTMYLASRGVYMMIKVADYAVGVLNAPTMKDVPRLFIKRHLKAFALTIVMIMMVVISLIFLSFGKSIIKFFIDTLDVAIISEFAYSMYRYVSFPIVIIVTFALMTIFYSMLPTIRLKFKKAIPGAAFATLGVIFSSFVLRVYVTFFFNRNVIYGTLSSIIMLLLWFFLLSYVLLLGIMINYAIIDTSPEE